MLHSCCWEYTKHLTSYHPHSDTPSSVLEIFDLIRTMLLTFFFSSDRLLIKSNQLLQNHQGTTVNAMQLWLGSLSTSLSPRSQIQPMLAIARKAPRSTF